MDLDQIRHILDLVREHEISEFEVEHEGMRIKIRKDGIVAAPVAHGAPPSAPAGAPAAVAGGPSAAPAQGAPGDGSPASSDESDIELAVVKSPIVGTFYRASEPGAKNFVEVGSMVKKGDVLCIIEAMKLMNEIDSEYDG